MKRLLFLWLILLLTTKLFSQKIQGTYFGEIVSGRNALVIMVKDSAASGFLYLDKTDRFEMKGIYVKPAPTIFIYRDGKLTNEIKGKRKIEEILALL